MALRDITRDYVLKAIDECDRLGQKQFREKYRRRKAKRYVLRYEGKDYDSKAILSAAHELQFPFKPPLRAIGSGLHGGKPVISKLRQLSFTVVNLDTGREM